MAGPKDPFDPYHKWLAIPKDQRPPTYYQLLGISLQESDREVIEEAAVRQSMHLRTYQIGPNAELCTRLLNEIARAQQTLLHPQKKKAYDEQLAQQASMAHAISARPIAVAADDAVTFAVVGAPRRPARDSRQRPAAPTGRTRTSVGLLVGGIAGGVLVLGAALAAWAWKVNEPAPPRVVLADVNKKSVFVKIEPAGPAKKFDKPAPIAPVKGDAKIEPKAQPDRANVIVPLSEAMRFNGHSAGVTGLQEMGDGLTFSSASLDGTIRVWRAATAKQEAQLDTAMPILTFGFSPSQRFVAALAKDRLRVYEWADRQLVVGPTQVIAASFWGGPDTLFSSRADGGFENRDFFRKEMSSGPRFVVPGAALSGSFGKPFFITLGNDVRLFRTTFGPRENTSLAAPDAICAAFADDRWLVVGSSDHRLRAFNVDSGELTGVFEGAADIPRALAVSKDGRYILAGGDDKIVRLWDVATAKEIARSAPLPATVRAVAFFGDAALSAGDDHVIRLWHPWRDKK
jgi:hypothetical protein